MSVLLALVAKNYYEYREKNLGTENLKIKSAIDHWHQISVDFRMGLRPHRNGHDRIAILAIDEDSISTEGRWPWNRKKIAELIEKTISRGAKILSFDIIYAEEDTNSSAEAIKFMREKTTDSKTLKHINKSAAMISETLDEDQILANTIKKYADQIVLGVYSQGEAFRVKPFTELCLDSLYKNSYAYEYWENNSISLKVIDHHLEDINDDRKAISKHLIQYFTLLDVSVAQEFLDNNPIASNALLKELQANEIQVDASYLPGILVMALKNDLRNGKELLKEIIDQNTTYEVVKSVFRSLKIALGEKNKNLLNKKIARVGSSYCQRFFTEDDELINLTKFTPLWGESEDATNLFKTISWAGLWTKENSDSPGGQDEVLRKINQLKDKMIPNEVNQVAEWTVNIPKLMSASKHSGYFNAILDKDGLIRRTKLVARHGNFYSPSLAFKTFLLDNNLQAILDIQIKKDSEGRHHKTISKLTTSENDGTGSLEIPVDASGTQKINYYGPHLSFPHISATQLLDDHEEMTISWRHQTSDGKWIEDKDYKVKKNEFLKDKIIFVGATAIGIYDLRVTPLDSNFPGVETHANVLSNLMVEKEWLNTESSNKRKNHGFLSNIPSESWVMPLSLVVIGTFQSIILVFLGAIISAFFTLLLLGLIVTLDHIFLFENGHLTTIIFPILLVTLLYMILTLLRYFSEERKKKNLKSIFEKYVSREVVDEILSKPGAIALGGRKERMTVLFSDIREFTRIAEAVSPEALSQILNAYFTPMTNLIYENRGTLDKYIGDAIMAFWGAPLPFAAHAEKAAKCALQMQDTLKILANDPTSRLRGLKIGIGINTGEMSVGNMGSETIRSYTVIGDAVNIGARLESLTKEYGVNILISADTYNEIKEKFWCREIENVYVKGKQTAVTVYELLAEKNGPSRYESFIQEYHLALKLYNESNFTESADIFKRLTLANSEDKILWRYLKLCQKKLEGHGD